MRKDLATFLRELATDPLTPEEIARLPQRARDLLDGKPPPGVRKNGKIPKAPAPGRTKVQKRNEERERLARLAEIRVALHAEASGLCAVCSFGLPFVRMHAHHILSGPERRSEERRETMAPTHEACHEALHGRNPKLDQLDALVALLNWLETRAGREQAIASTRKRIAKVLEARGVPVRVEERR